MEYKIVASDDYELLQKSINIYLDRGWKVQGGISACATIGGIRNPAKLQYVQAIIKIKGE